jgi:lipopolysaccharide export LptBFGC system permease protein LptF
VLRGAPELTLSELRPLVADGAITTSKLVGADDRWQIAVSYYGRLAVACASIVFAMFAMFAAALVGRKRFVLVVGVACGYVGYFLIEPELLKSWPPMAVAWLPNVALASVSLLLAARIPSRR